MNEPAPTCAAERPLGVTRPEGVEGDVPPGPPSSLCSGSGLRLVVMWAWDPRPGTLLPLPWRS